MMIRVAESEVMRSEHASVQVAHHLVLLAFEFAHDSRGQIHNVAHHRVLFTRACTADDTTKALT